ncbi:hypothetical protein GCM10027176_67200 [Actinoallomurus bryophytorum]
MGAHLILVEGMIGAGKSTMAGRLEHRLTARGEKARAYLEFAEDHPIRTKAVDLLRAAYPEPVWAPGDVGEDGLARDRSVYSPQQWGRLAERCGNGGRTVILESTFLQNSVLPAFLNGAPAGKCQEIFARIEEQLAPARPLLVYLRPADTAAAVERVHGARSAAWTDWNMASVAAFPWARSRDLHGRDAVIALYRAWEGVVDELLAGYPFPKIILSDPQDDWDAALRHIEEKARP